MPKKTKKQKLHAKHRIILPNNTSFLDEKSSPQKLKTVDGEIKPTRIIPAASLPKEKIFNESPSEQTYFKHDLAKTLIITLLIICAQVALYILQISGTIDMGNLISF